MGHRGWAAPPLASPANCAMLEGGQGPLDAFLAVKEGELPMADDRGVTHYDLMPIPPIEAQTRFFKANPIVIGVEYRLLDEEIAASSETATARGSDMGPGAGMDDRGVSLHVYAVEGGEKLEHLRFDCFDEDPHYHYVSWKDRTNQMVHIDVAAVGDPVDWALDCIGTRLPQMLDRAGAEETVKKLDLIALQTILPRVTEAAYQARFNSDEQAVRISALGEMD
ncbi:MAG: hypothetical protein CBC48_07400 [bacterium TMED88]|nr:hypothetical protein [Deltaproteobacteria bacterium]OUV32916.1 MAG: hypothetical protein CBC48_07400 [bacterium TMED88]